MRLCSKNLRNLASELIKLLHVDCKTLEHHPAANFQLFPTAEVHVCDVSISALHLLTAQPMASAVASIAMLDGEAPALPQDSQQLAVLSELPKLSSFAASPAISAFTTLPQTLRSLVLGVTHDAKDFLAVAKLTQLTSLQLEYNLRAFRPLHTLGRLRQLKQLTLKFSFELLSVLAPLANLESLDLQATASAWEQYGGMTHVPRLRPIPSFTKLTSLSIDGDRAYWFDRLDGLSVLKGLSQLTVRGFPDSFRPASNLNGLLHKLPRLAELGIPLQCDGSVLAEVPMANMRSLVLQASDVEVAVAALSRDLCTALTRLEVHVVTGSTQNLDGLMESLASLTRLRSLSLCGDLKGPCPSPAAVLRALTELTALSVQKWGLGDADVAACVAQEHLRQLRLAYEPLVTAAAIPHLYRLTCLSYLELNSTGLHAEVWTPDVLAPFNDIRRTRGWPDLSIKCWREPQWPGGGEVAPWDSVPPGGDALGDD